MPLPPPVTSATLPFEAMTGSSVLHSQISVMAGLDPAIHGKRHVDPRDKPGDDELTNPR
jgi:hypothetical protein